MNNHQYVLFKLDNEYYGLNIHEVRTIERVSDITRVPNAPSYVEGVINLRGDVVPVINLRKRFSLPQIDLDEDARIIIVSVDDMTVGLLVDSSSEVLQLSAEDIDTSANLSSSIENDYVVGIGKDGERIIILLDLKKVLFVSQAESA
ncbi:MAG TPA: purine-binding chemotaxis protein CheW [Clostridiales bacterium]|nr:purine-binding chemotaxis protein CheW [Clostridiales bacterium]